MNAWKFVGSLIYRHSPIGVQNLFCTLEGMRLERLRYGGEFNRWAEFYGNSRKWSEAALREYQREQVTLLLRECYEQVPFYAERWRAVGVSPASFHDLPDLAKFPCTTKEDLFEHGEKFISCRVHKRMLVSHTTSGSTGMPLVRYFTPGEVQRHYAIFWDRMRPGVKRGDRYAAFQGRMIVPLGQKHPPFWRENRAARQRLYSIQHLTRANLRHYAESLIAEPFVYYQGYANFLAIVAEYMFSEGIRPSTPPRAVFSTSEELSPGMRTLMEKVWRTRVWNEYCQAERCALITECEHGNYHAQMEYGVIEYEPVGRENGFEVAEIVCTGLIPRASPLVRYRIGDRVLSLIHI
ncbi:MAG: hypothetical protein N2255_03715, partial [Kiritimatiellae bacterium]|nr:hypothetical protein [Kiritimatiellia bacterium]